MLYPRRSRCPDQSPKALIAVVCVVIAALVPMPGAGNGPAVVAGTSDGLLVRVEPASPVVNQHCSSPATAAPGRSRSVTPASLDPSLLTINSPLQIDASAEDSPGLKLRFDERAYDLLKNKELVTVQDFALSRDRRVSLDLRRVEVFDDQTVFVAGTSGGDRPVPVPDVVLLAGSVRGAPASAAFLGLSRTGINGFVNLGDSTYIVSSGPPQPGSSQRSGCVISNLGSVDEAGVTSWLCRSEEMPPDRMNVMPASGAETAEETPGLRVCNVAIDCDYQYFREMGEDEAAALNYVAVLVAAVSSIYERDLDVALRLSYVRVWTTEDPYQTCGWDGLTNFQSLFRPAGPRPHLAFKFSGCGGAAAAMGTLSCPTSANGSTAVAVGRIQGFFPYPVAPSEDNWDFYAVAHEIGHIFGSPHTHCYDPPLDRCNNSEGACYDSAVVCSRGSIMSYCNQCGGFSNIDFEFPPRVAERMAPLIAAACMDVTDGWFYIFNDDATTLRVDSITTARQWMSVSRSAFLIAPRDSQRVAIVADWNQFTTPQQTGLLSAFFSGAQEPLLIPVTANRYSPFAAFSASGRSGCAPLTVQFADQSAGQPTAWLWHFGDGKSDSAQNPAHVYDVPGTYTARMEASNSCGAGSATESVSIVVSGPACHFESPFIVNRNDSLIRACDLWPSAGGMTSVPDSLEFDVEAISRDSCGARIDNNRYLSISPVRGWSGDSYVTVRTTDPRGCGCGGTIRVVINVPSSIEIVLPDEFQITNRRLVITWRDEDPDDDAQITLYRSENPDCSNGVAIIGKPLSEDMDGSAGSYDWFVAGVPDSRYYIRAVIADQTSSSDDCSQGSVLVDRTPPTTTISTYCAMLDSNGWCRSNGMVTLAATDNLSGVSRTLYRVNNGGWQQYRRPFWVDAQGASTVEYLSMDVAGNAEHIQAAMQPFRIDTRMPFISKLALDNEHFVDGDYMSPTPEFSFQLLDDGSGIDLGTLQVTIEPGTSEGRVLINSNSAGFSYDTLSYTARVIVPAPLAPGRQTLTVTATDHVGNIGVATVDFQVDDILRLEHVISFPNPTPGPAQFTFHLTQEASVSIRIYDLSGNLVRHMTGIPCKAGYNALPWDGWSDRHGLLAGGAYIYEVTASNDRGSVRRLEKLAVLR
jgi:PKD repeat protein